MAFVQKLQILFPKWTIAYVKINNQINISISNEHFTETFTKHGIKSYMHHIKDIYESIDYVVEFLCDNGFVLVEPSFYSRDNIRVYITVLSYKLNNCNHKPWYECTCKYEYYDSSDIIIEIKKLIEYENPYKKVQIE